ncbi:hypothetical protein F4821DRAFT_280932 [Hypoxylon rubiginosum]|uniref:Uncharacterized protein n=1 Tax=Hypoxylon rubiginosum TaxID=110542 RepID=A0ACC0CSJ7_9PEZI|nr:hypothetical protein F4821DRAFT_280932 [Hypoxylon rubiginosum]
MKFTSMLAVLASLVAMTSAMPTPFHDNGSISLLNQAKRTPCPKSSDKAASAEYKRDTASAEDEDEGDDTPGNIVACAY